MLKQTCVFNCFHPIDDKFDQNIFFMWFYATNQMLPGHGMGAMAAMGGMGMGMAMPMGRGLRTSQVSFPTFGMGQIQMIQMLK